MPNFKVVGPADGAEGDKGKREKAFQDMISSISSDTILINMRDY